GHPFRWRKRHIGPLTLSAQIPTRPPLADVLGTWSTWDSYILPGFSKSLGRGWPLVLALAVTGAIVAIVVGRGVLERFAGAAVIVGIVAGAVLPYGGGFGRGALGVLGGLLG